MNFSGTRIIETAVSNTTYVDQDNSQLTSFFRTLRLIYADEEVIECEWGESNTGRIRSLDQWIEADVRPVKIHIKKRRKRKEVKRTKLNG